MDITVGAQAIEKLRVDTALLDRFMEFSGDRNPIHVDDVGARQFGYGRRVAHGIVSTALLSRLIGTRLPGPGAMCLGQKIAWEAAVYVDDEITMTGTVVRISAGAGTLDLEIEAVNQRGTVVMTGEARVKMPTNIPTSKPSIRSSSSQDAPRLALITGASRGIGATIALRLAADHRLALNYRTASDKCAAVVRDIEAKGGEARGFQADVALAGEALVKEVLSTFGRIDVVVHAATPRITSVKAGALRWEDVEPYLKTYVEGAMALVRGAAPAMVERGYGRIVLLGAAAMLGSPPSGWGPYLIGKHALHGLARTLAVELGPAGITCNMVSPGLTLTELSDDVPARVKEVEARRNPLRRLATASDTAELVAYLASPAGGYLNGANLPVTGGPT